MENIKLMFLISLITICRSQINTTINTCANEKKVLKLDIRQRVQQLQPGSMNIIYLADTIEDIDAYALCQEAFYYDYIWLNQLMTPSQYNFQNTNGNPQQANDYRILGNIKEYQIDPQLGSLTNLYNFQQNVKKYCLHMKFLGEFSFYVPKDSYLIQNGTRFLQKPLYDSPNIYSDRYDDENFQWAMNDQMKTVPYAVPWNYFIQSGFQDMQDIIYRIIITLHKLDGIVFLQPSLGLYQSVLQKYYLNEINDQGNPLYFNDFYENINLQSLATNLYFMGGEDNSQFRSKLLNYLQIIYNQPTPDNNWINTNYTVIGASYVVKIDDKNAKCAINNQFDVNVAQNMHPTKNSCIRYNFTTYGGGMAGVNLQGTGFYVILSGYTQDVFPMIYGYGYSQSDGKRNSSFYYGNLDILEVQFEPQQYLIRIRKLYQENNQQGSLYMAREPNYQKINFVSSATGKNSILNVAFPFMYSPTYKHSSMTILGHRHIQLSINDLTNFYFAQVEPSINQAETNFTLNFYNLYFAPGSQVGLGVCDRERLQQNNHKGIGQGQGLGVYVLNNNGQTWHNSTVNQQVGKTFDQYDLISVSYWKSNNSVLYYINKTYLHSFSLIDNVKNLNFCLSMIGQYSTVYLEY